MVGIVYADSSALVKLVVEEQHSAAMAARVEDRVLVTSVIARVEVPRGAARAGAPGGLSLLPDSCVFVGLDEEVVALATSEVPSEVRSLDAIHVATALLLAPELEAFLTYDRRQAAAALAAGLPVEAPGRELFAAIDEKEGPADMAMTVTCEAT